jgi:prolycopene isomerase
MTSVPFKTLKFWDNHKKFLCEKLINKVNKLKIIPDLGKFIKLKFIGTPHTLCRYTSNREGAFAGWLPTVNQTVKTFIPQETSIKNLFLAGHWCTTGYLHYGGIPNVVFLGRRAASLVLRKLKNE